MTLQPFTLQRAREVSAAVLAALRADPIPLPEVREMDPHEWSDQELAELWPAWAPTAPGEWL